MKARDLKSPSSGARSAATLGREPPFLAGRYFTNGAALYRLVGWRQRPGEPARVEFEDCATLRLAMLTREALAMMALRPVALATSAAR